MSRRIAAHSMTKTVETAVNPAGEKRRCHTVPSPRTATSMEAWPSMEPDSPFAACVRAVPMSSWRSQSRKATATMITIRIPPTNSASVNCQPNRIQMMIPSSITRFVEAIAKAMAAVKLAPSRKSERASATAAYEHDDEAAPSSVALVSVGALSPPSVRMTSPRRTTARTTPDNANPRIRAQRISHAIAALIMSALPIAWSTGMIHAFVARPGVFWIPPHVAWSIFRRSLTHRVWRMVPAAGKRASTARVYQRPEGG